MKASPKSRSRDEPARLPWDLTLRRLRHRPTAILAGVLLAVLAFLCVALPPLLPYAYDAQNLELGASPPSARHWFGTDVLGRDLFVRVLHGGRLSLAVGICATGVSLAIGVTYGAAAAWLGSRADAVMMRIVDVLYALPFSLFAILLTVVFGRHLLLLFLAIGAVEWLTMARIVRAQVLTIRAQPFVEAARILDYSALRVLLRHIVPNVIGPVVVYATLTIPRVMLMEGFLSFLGLGVQPPRSSWGLLIRDGAEAMESYPWLLIFPGMALSATLLALNLLGDALRDALDPRFEATTIR